MPEGCLQKAFDFIELEHSVLLDHLYHAGRNSNRWKAVEDHEQLVYRLRVGVTVWREVSTVLLLMVMDPLCCQLEESGMGQ